MKIRQVDAFAVRLPLAKVMVMAGVEIRHAENLVVCITTDSGHTGWGEAASAPSMTGETTQSMVAAVRYLTPFILGMRPDDFTAMEREWAWRLYGNHAAKSALDMALLDLCARARQLPVRALLGVEARRSVPVLWLIGTGDVARDVEEAHAKKAQGVRAYKIKIGNHAAQADAARTLKICEALGAEVLISADANQGYDVPSALAYVRAVSDSTLAFVEQPVSAEDLDGMASVAAASRILVGADEGIHSLRDLRLHHELGAAHGASLKTIKLGGLRAVVRAGALCQALGLRVNLACKIAESSLASAALLQLAAVLPSLDWGVSLTCQYLQQDLVRVPLEIADGVARCADAPGLGVEVDPLRVREHQF